jgi:hypothetical protein
MDYCLEGIEQTSAKNCIVWIVHVYHIEGYVFSSCILEVADGYMQRYGAYEFNSSPPETMQWLCCFFQLLYVKPHLIES